MKRNTKLLLFLMLTSLVFGILVGHYYPQIRSRLSSTSNKWDSTKEVVGWPEGFSLVTISSSADGTDQAAYFLRAQFGLPKPLVVSLHTWSGDYSQNDPLAQMSKDARWNYIHPNFRGPNWTVDACLSEKVIADIDDAIQYAIDNGNVDIGNTFVVGASGGGYVTLGTYLKTRHRVRAFLSWVPISDLSAWYYQSLNSNSKYAKDILKCTSDGTVLNEREARLRSPLFWNVPEKPKSRLEIYVGINDGYTGSVPISHSILFYNRIAQLLGNQGYLVSQDEIVKLLTRGIGHRSDLGVLGDRRIYFRRGTDRLSLTVFDGGHEMLPDYCFNRMKMIAELKVDLWTF
ncbi:MAG: prolyl oligopeptidase family serine peptidase [Desulfobacula sp.]|jgi:pimeloyl-ACP methyl ester carboxylesterase|nr:prolyl oligopeptidase family serine peptidase [Desulfobacula sp.]